MRLIKWLTGETLIPRYGLICFYLLLLDRIVDWVS